MRVPRLLRRGVTVFPICLTKAPENRILCCKNATRHPLRTSLGRNRVALEGKTADFRPRPDGPGGADPDRAKTHQ
ncbi:hypothetical protein AX27061_1431 [Achromobacter xylosoxidans NBRC 15126 = ATCC 27061]|nr:hypothetical protein AX27061_1431 [Achromobacter xylosoxidans NBRC 15126 = ATCC 27061]CCH04540.1 hypothetical protein NH44784_005561 [Achromobacter xylosoxidans NH44784-1996]